MSFITHMTYTQFSTKRNFIIGVHFWSQNRNFDLGESWFPQEDLNEINDSKTPFPAKCQWILCRFDSKIMAPFIVGVTSVTFRKFYLNPK